jgi:hypothetical protein
VRTLRTTRADVLLLAGAFLLSLAVRFLSFPAATSDGLRLVSPDCYGHLRRSTAVARNFPRVPVRDAWLNHPDGGVFIWPPLFDLLVGGSARLAFGAGASQEETARVLATLPPFLGALHIVPLFFLARRVLSRRRAALAVAGYAVLPAAAIWSQFGHGDHHVAETLLLLLLLLALARSCDGGLSRGASLRRALVAGAGVAAMVLTWQGAVFAAALSFLWAALALAPVAAAAFALSATALTALGTLPWATGLDLPFTFVSFGWFQPAFLLAGSAAVALLAAIRARGRSRLALATLALLLAAGTAPLAPSLSSAVLRGTRYVATHAAGAAADEMDRGGYLSYPKDLLAVIAEARPLVKAPIGKTLRAAVEELSPGLVLLPVAVLVWGRRRSDRRLLALFGGILFLMTLSQQRNVYYLAPFAALALAETLPRLLPRRLLGRAPVTVSAALLLVALPGLPHYARIVGYAGSPGSDLVGTLERLRVLDPPPVDPARLPQPAPGTVEGVFAPWSAGHFVTALTGRPSAADPFGYGWRRQARLYTTTDDAEAETRCRWLFTTDLSAVLPAYAAAAGRAGTPPGATFAVRVHEASSPTPLPFLELAIDSRTAYRTRDGRLVPRFRVWRVKTASERGEASPPAPAVPGAGAEPAPPAASSARAPRPS